MWVENCTQFCAAALPCNKDLENNYYLLSTINY